MKKILINLVGSIYLYARKVGNIVASRRIKRSLKHCGKNVYIGDDCHIIPSHVSIGNNVSIGYNCSIMASLANIYIGNNVMFAPGVVIRGGGIE